MTNEEKKILIHLLKKSIKTTEHLKFKYLGHATSFGEAMYLSHIKSITDDDLNDLLEIDKNYLQDKINEKIDRLNNIISQVQSL